MNNNMAEESSDFFGRFAPKTKKIKRTDVRLQSLKLTANAKKQIMIHLSTIHVVENNINTIPGRLGDPLNLVYLLKYTLLYKEGLMGEEKRNFLPRK